ncbi:hypothetical protein C0Q70_09595 [Pomacea canaliculata]|uniref:Uncharacterized protein n=1 Tax=Pomacea canaliculata TaxID=400727 RepID=A0A2T7PA98_POMCA|nr:hypothetical protein C0Q70_09595 [Pomacea canaliculata]
MDFRCDDGDDCEDASDEMDCPTLHPSVCNDRMTMRGCVLMNDTSTPICLDDDLGFKLCRNMFDFEFHFAASTCGDGRFECTSGECIMLDWTCDNQFDCFDGSDERDCPTLHPSVCSDIMSIRDCVLMNETAKPICEHGELGFKYCRKFCDLCQSQE